MIIPFQSPFYHTKGVAGMLEWVRNGMVIPNSIYNDMAGIILELGMVIP